MTYKSDEVRLQAAVELIGSHLAGFANNMQVGLTFLAQVSGLFCEDEHGEVGHGHQGPGEWDQERMDLMRGALNGLRYSMEQFYEHYQRLSPDIID
jgi:hypothetical protein